MLSWRQDGDLHFAHSKVGFYVIQQLRRRYILTLDLKGTKQGEATQDLGEHKTLAKAKSEANKTDRVVLKQLQL